MYDKKVIIPGIVIFLWLFLLPFWYNMGKATPPPEPKTDTPVIKKLTEKKCIEDTAFMKTTHMQLLNDWRDSVVRERNRVHTASNGKQYEMSLQKECMNCHSNKSEFCDKCHDYVAVKPYCWDCHLEPKEKK
ncbi:MAG: sulfate reduction electron transfer complex DsrMKJOP subunit DsrJ [Pseudomonadota bacterium]